MTMPWVFDRPHAQRLTFARQDMLRRILPYFISNMALRTAVDMGCGIGYFTAFLRDEGLVAAGLDGRQSNIEEALRRNPDISFRVMDIEDKDITTLGMFDLTLCFGLLYHLENPFRAIRNLYSVTGKILMIESMYVPLGWPALLIRDEGEGLDQALNRIALYPSQVALVKMSYQAGFSHVYEVTDLPDHKDYRASMTHKQRRTVLVASRFRIDAPFLRFIPQPRSMDNPWVTRWGRTVEGFSRLRRFARRPWAEKLHRIRFRMRTARK
jgi:tRNA (mo5U34)-methyltransferase